jgi:hypothetical protein
MRNKEGKMSSRITLTRVIGLVFIVAALGSGSATAAIGYTDQGRQADGLRWQAMANHFVLMRGATSQGLQADGLRYQAMARFYANRPAAAFYTPQALRADALRWQARARFYAQPAVARGTSSGFDWSAAAIGGAGTIVIVLSAGALVLAVRRMRHEKLAI